MKGRSLKIELLVNGVELVCSMSHLEWNWFVVCLYLVKAQREIRKGQTIIKLTELQDVFQEKMTFIVFQLNRSLNLKLDAENSDYGLFLSNVFADDWM